MATSFLPKKKIAAAAAAAAANTKLLVLPPPLTPPPSPASTTITTTTADDDDNDAPLPPPSSSSSRKRKRGEEGEENNNKQRKKKCGQQQDEEEEREFIISKDERRNTTITTITPFNIYSKKREDITSNMIKTTNCINKCNELVQTELKNLHSTNQCIEKFIKGQHKLTHLDIDNLHNLLECKQESDNNEEILSKIYRIKNVINHLSKYLEEKRFELHDIYEYITKVRKKFYELSLNTSDNIERMYQDILYNADDGDEFFSISTDNERMKSIKVRKDLLLAAIFEIQKFQSSNKSIRNQHWTFFLDNV